jgi:hypothetical protein
MKKLIFLLFFFVIFFSCNRRSNSNNKILAFFLLQLADNASYIIPLYSYPQGQYQSQWEALYNLQTLKQVFVVVNPNNGPGSSSDPNYLNAITILKLKKFKVIGYVSTSYAVRNIAFVKNDINQWFLLYGLDNVDGIFLDEVSNDNLNYSYYQNLYNYIKSFGNKEVVLNPGTNVDLNFFRIADKIIVFENSQSSFETFVYNNYLSVDSYKVCTIVYSVPPNKVSFVISKILQNNSKCYYILDKDNVTGYFYLSPYLD